MYTPVPIVTPTNVLKKISTSEPSVSGPHKSNVLSFQDPGYSGKVDRYVSMDEMRQRTQGSTNPFLREQTYLKTPLPGPPSPNFKRQEYLGEAFSPFSSPIEHPTRSMPTLAGIIGTIPPFSGDGDENIELFFSHFERASRSGHWNEDIKLSVLTSRLRGKALKSYNEGIGLIYDISYEETKEHLLSMYRNKESKFEKAERFFRNVQRVDESVESYYFRMKALSGSLGDDPTMIQGLMLEKFVDGLKVEIARQVIMYQPRNVLDALYKAKEIETLESRLSKRTRRVASLASDSPVDEFSKYIESKMNDLQSEVNNINLNMKTTLANPVEPRVIICDYCGGRAHTESRCPQRIRNDHALN